MLVATGGLSYRSTGSTGDGYRFARETGHKVTELSPSLVPLCTKEEYISRLQGLSLKNTELTIKQGKKSSVQGFWEMMFTHFGVTGPMILSASAHIGKQLEKSGELQAFLDLKPALTMEQLDARILREFEAGPNKQFKNVIGVLFPSSHLPRLCWKSEESRRQVKFRFRRVYSSASAKRKETSWNVRTSFSSPFSSGSSNTKSVISGEWSSTRRIRSQHSKHGAGSG